MSIRSKSSFLIVSLLLFTGISACNSGSHSDSRADAVADSGSDIGAGAPENQQDSDFEVLLNDDSDSFWQCEISGENKYFTPVEIRLLSDKTGIIEGESLVWGQSDRTLTLSLSRGIVRLENLQYAGSGKRSFKTNDTFGIEALCRYISKASEEGESSFLFDPEEMLESVLTGSAGEAGWSCMEEDVFGSVKSYFIRFHSDGSALFADQDANWYVSKNYNLNFRISDNSYVVDNLYYEELDSGTFFYGNLFSSWLSCERQ